MSAWQSQTSHKKLGFTLAEVLITLGIIGVVAALTIPTLMQQTNERETIAKVKKDFAILSNAAKTAYANEGEFKGSTPKEFYDYISPYLSVQKYCGTGQGCWANTYIKTLSGASWNNLDRESTYEKAILNDGSSLAIYHSGTLGEFRIDTNGTKGPNTQGIDIFAFITRSDGMIYLYFSNNNPDYPDTGIVYGCNKTSPYFYSGYTCANWILYADNMDYLHCDDLSWKGKTKCD